MSATAMGHERGLDGVLLVDKSAGPTSHDIVQMARRRLGVRRIGHAGTLDPFATGLLLLCVGGATRLVRYLHLLPKTYRAELRLGEETATHDPEGEVTARSEAWRAIDRPALERAAARVTGAIEQVPPAFSAVKVEGRRAYRAARRGETIELEPRAVWVESLRVTAFAPPEAQLEVTVGTGTYVRALARDLGRYLGCGAHLRSLRRTAIGPFEVQGALPDRELGAGKDDLRDSPAWLSPLRALAWLPSRVLGTEEAERVRHGGAVDFGVVRPGVVAAPGSSAGEAGDRAPTGRATSAPQTGAGASGEPPTRHTGSPADLPVALVWEGELLAVAEAKGGRLQPRVVLDAA